MRGRNYANVRLPDGTEGWVKAAYLVEEKPAKLVVAETIAERDALAAELEQARASFAEPAQTIDRLRGETEDRSLKPARRSRGDPGVKRAVPWCRAAQVGWRRYLRLLRARLPRRNVVE